MSTTYHTPITTGAAANAAVVNSPLGELDQAITDNITTASTEVVNARSAGNVNAAAATLTERLAWLQRANVYSGDAYGMDEANSAADNLTALTAAVNAARVNNGIVLLPAGVFSCNGLTFPGDDVTIIGAGKPHLNAAGTALTGGTVLVGCTFDINDYKRILIMNLGIDKSTAGGNCIDSGSNGTTVQSVHVVNVAALSDGSSGTHGCVLTSGSHNVVTNFSAFDCDHGLVFRCSYSCASDIYAQNCAASTMTLKAIDTVDCIGNVVNNVMGYGSAAYNQGAFIVEAHDLATCTLNNVSNVYVKNATFGLQYKSIDGGSGHGTCTRNNFINFTLDTIQFDGVRIQGSASNVTQAHFTNFIIRTCGSDGFENQLTEDSFYLQNCVVSGAGADTYNGQFFTRQINGRDERLAVVSRTTAQAITTATWTEITHDEAKSETDGDMWDSVTDPEHLISPRDGYYKCVAHAIFAADATGKRGVRIVRSQDAAVVSQMIVPPVNGTDDMHVECQYIQNMNEDTYYTVEVYQDSGGNLDLEPQYFVSMELVAG